MSQDHPTDGIKAFISNRLLLGDLPSEEADAALELLGTLDPDEAGIDAVHPELEPGDDVPLVSSSWANTHR